MRLQGAPVTPPSASNVANILQASSEVFVVVSVTMFLPICLEQFARDNGVLLPEKIVPCVGVESTPTTANPEEMRCVVKLGWLWIDSASFRCASIDYLPHQLLIRFISQSICVFNFCCVAGTHSHLDG